MSRINVANFRHPNATADSITVTSDGDTQINRALGLGGATYGTSGQVLTSQGSGSAPQWATPVAGLTKTTLSNVTLSGSTTLLTGISSAAQEIFIIWENFYTNSGAHYHIRFNTTSGGVATTGYRSHSHFSSSTSGGTYNTTIIDFPGAGSSPSSRYGGLGRIVRRGNLNDWQYVFTTSHEGAAYYWQTIGQWTNSANDFNGIQFIGAGGTGLNGSATIHYYS